jgi:hypothetical protein
MSVSDGAPSAAAYGLVATRPGDGAAAPQRLVVLPQPRYGDLVRDGGVPNLGALTAVELPTQVLARQLHLRVHPLLLLRRLPRLRLATLHRPHPGRGTETKPTGVAAHDGSRGAAHPYRRRQLVVRHGPCASNAVSSIRAASANYSPPRRSRRSCIRVTRSAAFCTRSNSKRGLSPQRWRRSGVAAASPQQGRTGCHRHRRAATPQAEHSVAAAGCPC